MLDDAINRWMACVGVHARESCQLAATDAWWLLGLVLCVVLVAHAGRRFVRALMTVPAIALVPALSRQLSTWVKARDYDEEEFFRADGATEPLVERRRRGLDRLASLLHAQSVQSIAWGNAIRESFSDLRFTDANRVPFPFARVMRDKFNLCSVVTASHGPRLRSVDGNWTIDVSGAYGVNVAGFDRYKAWIQKGWDRVKDLGPVLGPLHPMVAENIAMLKNVSHLDEVSFHMSGTEAVMAAVRMARFNTRKKLIVCFSGAYHGWWDGVQPGLGSERPVDDCLTLKDLNPASLAVIRRRAKDIAAVLVNPVQSFHPNSPPPNDAVLLTSDVRKTHDSTERYASWLHQLREVCGACGVPLIFDEVYTGFRLAPGGAQEYFGVRADMVVYGKTVAGGLPIGVVCGKTALMRRFDADRPMRIAYVVGTFSAHPAVMGAMNEFLRWAVQPATARLYDEANQRCADWVQSTNQQMADASLPVRVVNLGTVWTVLFKEPGRYNWLLQYYLRAEGVTLSWVGTGRCLSSMDVTADDYRALQVKLVEAAGSMRSDGWWLTEHEYPGREKRMRMRVMWDMLGSLVPVPKSLQAFYVAVMQRKEDDHHASHNDKANQLLHLLSSSAFLYCYVIIFSDLTTAMCLGLASLFVRQFGHAILEPPCHDEEALLLGYTTRDKTLIVLGYGLIPVIGMVQADAWTFAAFAATLPTIALHWFRWTLFVVFLRVAYLIWKHNFRISMIWFVKLVTDPLTDVVTYFPRRAQGA
ncbi:MAG: aminotransferase class III-fold pyridoxal phosphate-dependent enzyme [Luteitalea sp.]|nr:aminotransferase class III-fold pyridoxal phosphate-dependent enzyme [Luteitalea sp.]